VRFTGRLGSIQLFEYTIFELLFFPIRGGLHEGNHNSVGLRFGGGELWLEERSQEKAACWRFDGANFSLCSAGDDRKAGLHGAPLVVWVDFEVAEEFFGRSLYILAIKRLQVRAGTQTNFGTRSRKLRRIPLAIGNSTRNGMNNDVLGSGLVLGAVRVWDAQHVAGAFDQRILEPAAGSEKRPVTGARELDALEHAIETPVRAAGRGPQAVAAFKNLARVSGGQ